MIDFDSLTIYLKVNYIFMCIQFVIGTVGITGNILLICVFSRKNLRKHSYSFYCQMKACGDIVVLLFAFRNWANFVMGANLDLVAPFLCVVNKFLPNLAGSFSLGILVIISLDRLVSVMYPNRFEFVKKKWFQAIITLLVLAYSVGIIVILPLNTTLMVSQVGDIVIKLCGVSQAIGAVFSWISNTNILLIILIINNVLNIKMIMFVLSSKKRVTSDAQQSRISGKERKMVISAIGLGTVALICKLPLGIATIILNYVKAPVDQVIMITFISITMLTIENTASFFINFWLNSMFHAEIFEMLGLKNLKSSIQITKSGTVDTNNKKTKSNQNIISAISSNNIKI